MEVVMDNNTNNRLDSVEKRLDSVENTLQSVLHKLNKLYVAVVGDETFDQEGYLHRLKRVEKEVEGYKILKWKLVGAFIGGGAVWAFVWEIFKKFFSK